MQLKHIYFGYKTLRRKRKSVYTSTLALIALALLFSACQEKIDVDYSKIESSPVLLVEGKITTDTTSHYVILNKTLPLDNLELNYVAGATITLKGNGQEYAYTYKGKGKYETAPDVYGVVGEAYELSIVLENGEQYNAETTIPNSADIDSVKFIYEEFENFELYFHNLYFHGWELPEEGNAYLWNIYMNGTLYNDTLWKTVFVEDEFVNGNYVGVNPLTGESNFAVYALEPHEVTSDTVNVLVEMESIPLGYYNFFVSLMQQTVWVGSPFDANKADPFTNISNGAMGYFYGANVKRAKTTYIRPEESKNVDQRRF